jgi:vacuolar-type H+-ATPase subunit E/Vma4
MSWLKRLRRKLLRNSKKRLHSPLKRKSTLITPLVRKGNLDDNDSDGSAGGVVVLGHGGKVEHDNTLEERLKLLESSSLPKMRASIFGSLPLTSVG